MIRTSHLPFPISYFLLSTVYYILSTFYVILSTFYFIRSTFYFKLYTFYFLFPAIGYQVSGTRTQKQMMWIWIVSRKWAVGKWGSWKVGKYGSRKVERQTQEHENGKNMKIFNHGNINHTFTTFHLLRHPLYFLRSIVYCLLSTFYFYLLFYIGYVYICSKVRT